jgi:hypothetical protein
MIGLVVGGPQLEMDTAAAPDFIPTYRQSFKLALNGYLYVVNRKSSKTTFWRCENYKTCPATATTSASCQTCIPKMPIRRFLSTSQKIGSLTQP